MANHEGMKRGYTRCHLAWYAQANHIVLPELSIGMYGPDDEGGTSGEFTIKWVNLNGRLYAKLSVFEDAWSAIFDKHKDLLKELAKVDGKNIQEPEMAAILDKLGIEDITPYEMPDRYK